MSALRKKAHDLSIRWTSIVFIGLLGSWGRLSTTTSSGSSWSS
jgi:hypothetical protein